MMGNDSDKPNTELESLGKKWQREMTENLGKIFSPVEDKKRSVEDKKRLRKQNIEKFIQWSHDFSEKEMRSMADKNSKYQQIASEGEKKCNENNIQSVFEKIFALADHENENERKIFALANHERKISETESITDPLSTILACISLDNSQGNSIESTKKFIQKCEKSDLAPKYSPLIFSEAFNRIINIPICLPIVHRVSGIFLLEFYVDTMMKSLNADESGNTQTEPYSTDIYFCHIDTYDQEVFQKFQQEGMSEGHISEKVKKASTKNSKKIHDRETHRSKSKPGKSSSQAGTSSPYTQFLIDMCFPSVRQSGDLTSKEIAEIISNEKGKRFIDLYEYISLWMASCPESEACSKNIDLNKLEIRNKSLDRSMNKNNERSLNTLYKKTKQYKEIEAAIENAKWGIEETASISWKNNFNMQKFLQSLSSEQLAVLFKNEEYFDGISDGAFLQDQKNQLQLLFLTSEIKRYILRESPSEIIRFNGYTKEVYRFFNIVHTYSKPLKTAIQKLGNVNDDKQVHQIYSDINAAYILLKAGFKKRNETIQKYPVSNPHPIGEILTWGYDAFFQCILKGIFQYAIEAKKRDIQDQIDFISGYKDQLEYRKSESFLGVDGKDIWYIDQNPFCQMGNSCKPEEISQTDPDRFQDLEEEYGDPGQVTIEELHNGYKEEELVALFGKSVGKKLASEDFHTTCSEEQMTDILGTSIGRQLMRYFGGWEYSSYVDELMIGNVIIHHFFGDDYVKSEFMEKLPGRIQELIKQAKKRCEKEIQLISLSPQDTDIFSRITDIVKNIENMPHQMERRQKQAWYIILAYALEEMSFKLLGNQKQFTDLRNELCQIDTWDKLYKTAKEIVRRNKRKWFIEIPDDLASKQFLQDELERKFALTELLILITKEDSMIARNMKLNEEDQAAGMTRSFGKFCHIDSMTISGVMYSVHQQLLLCFGKDIPKDIRDDPNLYRQLERWLENRTIQNTEQENQITLGKIRSGIEHNPDFKYWAMKRSLGSILGDAEKWWKKFFKDYFGGFTEEGFYCVMVLVRMADYNSGEKEPDLDTIQQHSDKADQPDRSIIHRNRVYKGSNRHYAKNLHDILRKQNENPLSESDKQVLITYIEIVRAAYYGLEYNTGNEWQFCMEASLIWQRDAVDEIDRCIKDRDMNDSKRIVTQLCSEFSFNSIIQSAEKIYKDGSDDYNTLMEKIEELRKNGFLTD